MLAGDNPPDVFSYWAGARVQFVVDSDALMELSDFWNEEKLGDIVVLESRDPHNTMVAFIPFHKISTTLDFSIIQRLWLQLV